MHRIIACALVCGLATAGLAAQITTPAGLTQVTTYTLAPTWVGGLAFDPSGAVLYANAIGSGAVQAYAVTRDPGTGQITGFGSPVTITSAAGCDGGLAVDAAGTWVWTTWPSNSLGSFTGSATAAADLTAAGVPSSTGGLCIAPATVPNAGDVLVSSYSSGGIYRITLLANPDGTYAVAPGSATLFASTPAFAEGLAYVPNGPYAGCLLNSSYGQNRVDLIVIDPLTGLPTGTVFPIITGPAGFPPFIPGFSPMGLAFDPVTNDLFLSTYASSLNLHHFTGTIRGDYERNSPAAALDLNGLEATLSAPARTSVMLGNPVTIGWSSTNPGNGFDIVVSTSPLVPSGLVLPDDQIVNVDLGSPFTFVFGGTFTTPFFNFSTPFVPPLGTLSAQAVVLDPAAAFGFSLSQAIQMTGLPCTSLETVDGTPLGVGSYPVGWSDGGGTQQWQPLSGATPTASTGPSGDHTSGSGVYMYCETSATAGSTFVLDLGTHFPLAGDNADFWFHMFGATTGTLVLQQQDAGGTWNPIWSLTGDQGDSWQNAQVPLAPIGGAAVLRFHYTSGSSSTGDAAIDDFGICQ